MTIHHQRQLLRPRHLTTPRRVIAHRAFTLIELIVVMSIIILVLSVILPVVNTLLGNRNIENTQNQVAGYLATARADAIQNRTPIGVCFFIDPASRQETLVEVQPITLPEWGNNLSTSGLNLWSFGWYPNMFTPIDIAGNRVVDTPTTGTLTAYRDALVLPQGVGVALVASPISSYPGGYNYGNVNVDRLVRLGVIMFDDTGTRMSIQYGIPGQTPNQPTKDTQPIPNALAAKLQLNNTCLQSQLVNILTTCSAFYIYDHNLYTGQTTSSGRPFQDGDDFYSPSWVNYFGTQDKIDEDNWIIANGTELTVSPYDGSLLKAK